MSSTPPLFPVNALGDAAGVFAGDNLAQPGECVALDRVWFALDTNSAAAHLVSHCCRPEPVKPDETARW